MMKVICPACGQRVPMIARRYADHDAMRLSFSLRQRDFGINKAFRRCRFSGAIVQLEGKSNG